MEDTPKREEGGTQKRWKAVVSYSRGKHTDVTKYYFDEFDELGTAVEGGPPFHDIFSITITYRLGD